MEESEFYMNNFQEKLSKPFKIISEEFLSVKK